MENVRTDRFEDQSLLEYKGHLTSEVRIQLLDLLQCIALFNLGPRNDLKKLVGVALELLDNAQRYNSSDEIDFRWHIEDETLVIMITNKASSLNAHRLMETVQRISRMNPKEVADEFRRQLTNDQYGKHGGAGLGMLQIAKKVGQNITAEIEPATGTEYLCTSRVTTALNFKKRA